MKKHFHKQTMRSLNRSRRIRDALKKGSSEAITALKAGDTVLLKDLQAAHEHMLDMLNDK